MYRFSLDGYIVFFGYVILNKLFLICQRCGFQIRDLQFNKDVLLLFLELREYILIILLDIIYFLRLFQINEDVQFFWLQGKWEFKYVILFLQSGLELIRIF